MALKPKVCSDVVEARRRFLAACGQYAVATPPAITLMLAAAERNYATASSGSHGRDPHGNHDHDRDHGSDKDDRSRSRP
jgi:hypothetical protein